MLRAPTRGRTAGDTHTYRCCLHACAWGFLTPARSRAVFRHLHRLRRFQRSLKLKLEFSLESFIIIRCSAELRFSSAGEMWAVGHLPASTCQIPISKSISMNPPLPQRAVFDHLCSALAKHSSRIIPGLPFWTVFELKDGLRRHLCGAKPHRGFFRHNKSL